MENIANLLGSYQGELYDLCFKILIENEGSEADVFQYVCEHWRDIDNDPVTPIEKYFTDSELDEHKLIYGSITDGILKSTLRKCNYDYLEYSDFYRSLWREYSSIFESVKGRAFAFWWTMIDRSTPYQYLGKPTRLVGDAFDKFFEKNKVHLKKIAYILDQDFVQSTEVASLILRYLEEVDDFDSKAFVLGRALFLKSVEACACDVLERNVKNQVQDQVQKQVEAELKKISEQEDESMKS